MERILSKLNRYFAGHIQRMTEETGIPKDRLFDIITEWYNGYSWDGTNFVYNPFSILSLFTENNFDNYWFSSGTPTFLIKIIKKQHEVLPQLESLPLTSRAFDSYDIERMEIASLLFQTGYLTVKKVSLW